MWRNWSKEGGESIECSYGGEIGVGVDSRKG